MAILGKGAYVFCRFNCLFSAYQGCTLLCGYPRGGSLCVYAGLIAYLVGTQDVRCCVAILG